METTYLSLFLKGRTKGGRSGDEVARENLLLLLLCYF